MWSHNRFFVGVTSSFLLCYVKIIILKGFNALILKTKMSSFFIENLMKTDILYFDSYDIHRYIEGKSKFKKINDEYQKRLYYFFLTCKYIID